MSRRASAHFARVDFGGSKPAAVASSTAGFSTSPAGTSAPAASTLYPVPHQRPSRRLLVLAAAALFILVALLHQNPGQVVKPISDQLDLKKWSASTGSGLSRVFGSSSDTDGPSHASGQRMTLIAMWDDDHEATYLPSFFTSAARNADAVDLLWINVMRNGDKCLDVSPYVTKASNIQAICISDREDKRMIADYLCAEWECTEGQVEAVDKHLETREDPIHCEFKPLRGSIYKEWVKTKWWAWVDADQIVGNFKDLWPWHIMDNFDVATISEWDVGNIYLRGQFTAFKTSPKLDRVWMKFPPLSSPEALPTLPHGPLDEFVYSVLYSNTLKDDIDWILVPRALGADKFGANKVVMNGKRAFYVPVDMRRRDVSILLDERFTPSAEPAFGMVNEFDPEKWAVPVRELGAGDYIYNKPIWKWCDQKDTRCTVMRESYWFASTLMRYKGQLLEYFDMRSKPRTPKRETYFGIEEKLFIHFQEIKRRTWFKMPPDGIGMDDILEIREQSVVMWNKYTLATTFEAVNKDIKDATTPRNELLAHDYWGINGTDEMPLPPGVEGILVE